MIGGSGYAEDTNSLAQDDLRQRIAVAIQERAAVLVWDTVAIFPFSGTEFLHRICLPIEQSIALPLKSPAPKLDKIR